MHRYSSPPLLRCSGAVAAPLAALRMLASSSSSSNPNPNHQNLNLAMKSTASEPSKASSFAIPHLPSGQSWSSCSGSPLFPRHLASPKCLSPGSTAPVSVINSAEVESGKEELEKSSLVVVSFYKFADFPDHAELRKPLKDLCEALRVSGGIILAPEGINGSLCGTRESVERVLAFIQSDSRLEGLRRIESPVTAEDEAIHHGHTSSSPVGAGEDAPFRWDHVRVKLKKEIVSLGLPSVTPIERVGKYISPHEWNELISAPDTVVIDVRNTYETRIGKFKGAVDPKTTAFREFPSWVENELQDGQSSTEEPDGSSGSATSQEAQRPNTPPRVAMYCTGGIRCEKASSFLLSKGFKEVYHLKGGILKYLEEIPKSESLWEGECFVFDKRVSVEHGLVLGTHKLCYGCKQPVNDADIESPLYEYGVSCPYCFSSKSEEEKERARARQRQFETWGVIGGPDKGRRPTQNSDDNRGGSDAQLSKSI